VLRGCDAPVGARRPRPAVELADIVREHGETFRRAHALTPDQHAVLRAIERCRTAVLGGHLDVCLACGRTEPSYNSCRNRHCPKCQSLAQARWIAGRLARILPTHYFHVVFTLPAPLRLSSFPTRSILCARAFLLETQAALTPWTREPAKPIVLGAYALCE
jgi:hypothetical protein